MIKVTVDGKKLATLQVQAGRTGPWVALKDTGQWYIDNAIILDSWACHYCGRCGVRWHPIFNGVVTAPDLLKVTVMCYICPNCTCACAKTIHAGVVQRWDNFLEDHRSLLPQLVTYDKPTWDTCNKYEHTVVSEGQFVGIKTGTAWLVGMAPYGLDMLTGMITNGRQAMAKLLEYTGLIGKSGWDGWPERSTYQGGWLIIDTATNPITVGAYDKKLQAGQVIRWGRGCEASPYWASATRMKDFMDRLQGALANPDYGAPDQRADFIDNLKLLGWRVNFNSEAWKAKLKTVLAPFGDPEQVLKPRRVAPGAWMRMPR